MEAEATQRKRGVEAESTDFCDQCRPKALKLLRRILKLIEEGPT
jgi:hypothetical protein